MPSGCNDTKFWEDIEFRVVGAGWVRSASKAIRLCACAAEGGQEVVQRVLVRQVNCRELYVDAMVCTREP